MNCSAVKAVIKDEKNFRKKNSILGKNLAKIITREWLHGDIVKIDALGAARDENLGMIIKKSSEEQQQIFPCYVVYDFFTKTQRDIFVYNLTLISARKS
jgi:hypothetical protein